MALAWRAGAWLWAAPFRGEGWQSGANERAALARAPKPLLATAADAHPVSSRATGAAIALASAAPAALTEPIRQPIPAGSALPSPASPFVNTRNFLLVGLDRRADGKGPALTDTLVVVVLNEKAGHVGLVSVPRDLYVELPDGWDRINTAYNVARRAKLDPLRFLARVVSDTLELPIEHVLALDLAVFERGIDALGGVEVQVPCAIQDRFIDARVPGGRRVLDVSEGAQRMDGPTAAMYVRSRHGRSDWSRARRQQAVLLGIRRELETFGGISKLPALWDEFEASVHTDLRRIELIGLVRRALAIEPSHLHGLVLGAAEARRMTSDGRSVLIPDAAAIQRALAGLFSAPSPGTRLPLSKCEPKDAALRAGAVRLVVATASGTSTTRFP